MFEAPFTAILCGATGSGKTRWLMRFLNHIGELIDPPPVHILYCYGEMNAAVMSLRQKGIEIFQGIPDQKLINDKPKPLLLVLDDLMLNMESDFLNLLFTRGSHNWNVSVIFVTQSLYGKDIKIARTNSHYIILMRCPSGQLQTRTLGSQLFPKMTSYFMDAYNDATEDRFSYLVINMHPNTPPSLRLTTKIFPGEKTVVYLPNN